MYRRGLDMNGRMNIVVPGISMRPTVGMYCALYGIDRATFVRPRCRRWWLELRRIRLRTRLSIFDGLTTSVVAADVKHRPLTADDILKMWKLCDAKRQTVAKEVRAHPDALRKFIAAVGFHTTPEKVNYAADLSGMQIMGLPVIEDPALGRDEMRIVYPYATEKRSAVAEAFRRDIVNMFANG